MCFSNTSGISIHKLIKYLSCHYPTQHFNCNDAKYILISIYLGKLLNFALIVMIRASKINLLNNNNNSTCWSAASPQYSVVNPAPRRLIDNSDPETAGWPVTLSPCKWAALGPGGCPCGPAPCLVVLSADWLAGARLFFMRCGPAAGTKTRRTAAIRGTSLSPLPPNTRVHREPVLPLELLGRISGN